MQKHIAMLTHLIFRLIIGSIAQCTQVLKHLIQLPRRTQRIAKIIINSSKAANDASYGNLFERRAA